ncbi:polysaccharide biosynthesis protein [Pseudoroseicyclus aestuarii]|uniref:polysaccharide biosynthesis protein n=1 Tax=Pseudoroseicyclus aestuarii TaxID=1795041 RepID=UPI001FE66446|nr:nucleoside-diphosphate sugar epimerase/dehydratase [Pseudoroseicyclus aestuarii]
MLAVDVILVPAALIFALALQHNGMPPMRNLLTHWQSIPLLMTISGLLIITMDIHKVQLKAYDGRSMLLTGLHAVLLGLATAALDGLAGYGTPFATFVSFTMVYFLMVAGCRHLMLQMLLSIYRAGQPQKRVLIYGAGRTGQQLVAALRTEPTVSPVAFIDDAKQLQGTIVHGLHVYAPVALQSLVRDRSVDRVLLAMPSVSRPKLAQLSRRLEDMGLDVQTLPSFAQLAGNGARLVEQLTPVLPGRFLGRAPLDDELRGGSESYAGKSILVSGAGGSIGSELCRQLLSCRPRRIVLLELSEFALYQLESEVRTLAAGMGVEIVPVLGSVVSAPLVRQTLAEYEVDVVLHAAAYKHVPLVEANPLSGFANNVLGTQVLATAAVEAGVARFTLISTDKAVRPRNMMGASKRLAELVMQDMASRSNPARGDTIFSMVRFGNVLDSSGSVLPLFREQIAKGGPITLTHKEVTRYFMTIPEAARLVLVAGSFASGGEVFVLDMGEPVSIHSLACQMIEAAGYSLRDEKNPAGDIEIRLTGLRAGEKLHEELLLGAGQTTTAHPKIMLARETGLSEIEVAASLKALRSAVAEHDTLALRAIIARYIEGGDAFAKPQQKASGEPRPAL